MKKHIQFLLSLLLIFALAVPALAAHFTDGAEIGEAYRGAVDDMTARGVLNGFPDGTFQPQGTLTREQGAKIVAYMVLGDEVKTLTCTSAPFDDVAEDRWSAPCIAWCAGRTILLGYGDGRFGPEDRLTGDQFAKMLLCALGLAREDRYVGYGDRWTAAVRADGQDVNLYFGDSGMMTDKPVTREQAALLAHNAMTAAEDSSVPETPPAQEPIKPPSKPVLPDEPETPPEPDEPKLPKEPEMPEYPLEPDEPELPEEPNEPEPPESPQEPGEPETQDDPPENPAPGKENDTPAVPFG